MSDGQYATAFIRANRVVRLIDAEDPADPTVVVGMVEPTDRALQLQLERFHTAPVRVVPISRSRLLAEISRLEGERYGEDRDGSAGGGDAPAVRFVDAVLYDAASAGASDVHLETGPTGAEVRYRIDGQLHTVRSYRSGDFAAVVARLKVMSRVKATERRLPQDGRFSFDTPNERFDVRTSFLPCDRGESVAIRLLSTAADTRSPAELGLQGPDAAAIEGIDVTTGGLIVVAGPTGSGKTTTVHALLRRHADGTRKVLTVEDPVEYRLPGVTQVQVHREVGLDFDDALRRALRHDPDILMVGEIRDTETAALAVRGALSGHPVFATVHAPDAAAIDARLENLGVPRRLLREAIAARLSQRLLRRVCPTCATLVRPRGGEVDEAARHGIRLESLRSGAGCEDCRGTGFRGRRGVFHVVAGSYRGPGLAAAAWRAVAGGETTPAEVARTVGLEVLAPEGARVSEAVR